MLKSCSSSRSSVDGGESELFAVVGEDSFGFRNMVRR